MLVKRAETAGFCMGVSLALHKLDNAIRKHGAQTDRTICTHGPIIHNPQVLENYERRGVVCLKNSDVVTESHIIVIRAHGVPRLEEELIRSRGATIIDATCPRVKKAQLAIAEATADGQALLLFGEADHPEVRGLISYAVGDHWVFQTADALNEIDLDPGRSWVLASQTTQDATQFAAIRESLEKRLPRLTVLSTICDATGERQEEARTLSAMVDAMVVIGGRSSGNTRRLAALAAQSCSTAYHVEDISELSPSSFGDDIRVIGLTAGASTPKDLIDKAEEWLSSLSGPAE